MSDNFYRAFEDKHRGSRELIKSRLEIYLPFIEKIKEIQPKPKTIDLGCGRGEWLELLSENDCEAQGIDLDEGMLQACTQRGFNVKRQDAIEALRNLDDASISVVSGFHIVEHLPFEVLQTLVQESLRVLKPGGILIMETPNPENIKVATENFYLDPTHIKPIPSALLTFLPEFYGYNRTKVLRLQESKEIEKEVNISLFQILEGVSPDYAIIAQKEAPNNILRLFDEIFKKDFGLSLHNLASRFENRLLSMEQKATQAEQKAAHAEEKAIQVEHNYHLILNSNSWKLMKPFRLLGHFSRWFVSGVKHWITFSPTSRPRRILKKLLISLKSYIYANPRLKQQIVKILNKFPKLKNRLKRINNVQPVTNNISSLSSRANEIYNNLKKQQKNNEGL
jgi:O-antigen chain-terminating methyltransferase